MARKSKGFGELLHHQKSLDSLQRRVQQNSDGKIAGVVNSPKGTAKMSEVLEDFIDPYLPHAADRQQREKLLTIAVMAWNLALISETERQQQMQQLIQEIVGTDRMAHQDLEEILNEMITRKLTLFPHNQRFIIDFQLRDTGKQFHLSVASTLPETK